MNAHAKRPPLSVLRSEIPAPVKQALSLVAEPFEPVGTLSMRHPAPTLPPVVVLARKGRPWAVMAESALAMVEQGADLFVSFETEAEFRRVAAELASAGQHGGA